jgi:hypothetical protein
MKKVLSTFVVITCLLNTFTIDRGRCSNIQKDVLSFTKSNTKTTSNQLVAFNIPIAVNDYFVINEDVILNDSISLNDTLSIDGGNMWSVVAQPIHGILVLNNNGSFIYTPNLNFYGNDTIKYQLCDIDGECDTAFIYIEINAVNDKPFAVDDTVTTAEDTPLLIDVAANDLDIDGNFDFTNLTIGSLPFHGITTIDAFTGIITYTPNQNYNGNDTIIYSICDDGTPLPSLCDTAFIFLTITSVNDKPIAIDDSATTDENVPLVIDVLSNDFDIDGNLNSGSLTIVTQPTFGVAIVNIPANTINYTPNQNYFGNDTLTYQICDLAGECDTANIYITINHVNLIPIPVNDTVTTDEDVPLVINVLSNDINIISSFDSSSLTVVLQPFHGLAVVNTITGKITYTSNQNYYGNDTLSYQICDTNGNCNTAFIYITINPVNDLPFAVNDTINIDEDTPLTIDVLLNDSDIDGNLVANSITISTPPNHGTATINSSTGEITYYPAPNYYGTDNIKYSVCDDGYPLPSMCNTAFVLITIAPVNDIGLPIANNDYGYTTTYTPLTINVLYNDLFGDVPCNCAIKATNGAHGSTTINNNGTPTIPLDDKIVYTPSNNTYLGPDLFTYSIFDIDGDSSIATVYIDITPMYAPTITAPINGALNQMPNPLINWTAVPSAFQYKFQISLDSLFGISQNYSTGLSAINLSNLLFNTKYYCRVKAMGVNDSSGWSNISVFRTLKTVTIIKPDNGSINRPVSAYFKWNAITGIADYEYQMDTSLTFSSPLFVTSIIAANKIEAYSKQLSFGEHYYLKMRARHSQDTTDWSAVTDFWTLTDLSIMKPLDNSINVAPVCKLQWEWVGSKFYEYAISTDSLFSTSVMHTFDTTKVVILISPPDTVVIVYSDTLLFGQKYYWKVRAKNLLDTSNWSAVKKFTIIDKLNLISPTNGATNIAISPSFKWDTINSKGITHYILEIDDDSTFASPQSKTLPNNSNQYTLTSTLAYNTPYFWRMKAYNGTNISDWSNTFKFKTIIDVGINTTALDNNLVMIYPNPSFNGKINIQIESPDDQDVMIYLLNMIGQEVYDQKLSVNSGKNLFAIDLTSSENGIYFLKLQNGETTLTRKIILSK